MQGNLLLRQRHVNAVFYGKRGGGAAAEYQIDGRKQRPYQTFAERIWALRVQGCASVRPVRRTEAAPCHRLRHFSGRRILILDEPTSGLDGQNMRLIAERLKSEARNGRTILVITHDRKLIESCRDNVVEVEKRSP